MTRTPTLILAAALLCLGSCDKESSPPAPASSSGANASTAPPPNPLGGPGGAMPSPSASPTEGTTLIAHSVSIAVPATWIQETPASSMRAAQYRIPSPPGSELATGEFIVFRGIGGSTADNLARWEKQITNPIGERSRATETAGGLTIDSLVQFGTYDAGMAMAGGPAAGPQNNWGFAGAVITGDPQGVIHLKLLGPKEVIEAELGNWNALLKSILDNATTEAP